MALLRRLSEGARASPLLRSRNLRATAPIAALAHPTSRAHSDIRLPSTALHTRQFAIMTDYTKLGAALTLGGAIGATAATLVLQKRALSAKAKATTPAHEQLLKLYIYDHCPFCVRARMIFGLKKIPHELIFLANHDEATPIGLVGAKQAPILQLASGKAFPESMDIVRYVDTNHGGSVLLKEASGREDLKQWIAESADAFRLVYHPRFHRAHFAEFATLESREYYRIKKEKYLGMTFDEALAKTPEIVAKANERLVKLAQIVHSNRSVNASGVSYDDIDIFGRLRGLTLVKDLKWPKKLREYVDYYSEVADIPLLDSMAQY